MLPSTATISTMSNYMQHHIYSYKVLTGTVNVVNLCGKQICFRAHFNAYKVIRPSGPEYGIIKLNWLITVL